MRIRLRVRDEADLKLWIFALAIWFPATHICIKFNAQLFIISSCIFYRLNAVLPETPIG